MTVNPRSARRSGRSRSRVLVEWSGASSPSRSRGASSSIGPLPGVATPGSARRSGASRCRKRSGCIGNAPEAPCSTGRSSSTPNGISAVAPYREFLRPVTAPAVAGTAAALRCGRPGWRRGRSAHRRRPPDLRQRSRRLPVFRLHRDRPVLRDRVVLLRSRVWEPTRWSGDGPDRGRGRLRRRRRPHIPWRLPSGDLCALRSGGRRGRSRHCCGAPRLLGPRPRNPARSLRRPTGDPQLRPAAERHGARGNAVPDLLPKSAAREFFSRLRSERTNRAYIGSRGGGVRTILERGEQDSGRRPEYQLLDNDLRLTVWTPRDCLVGRGWSGNAPWVSGNAARQLPG